LYHLSVDKLAAIRIFESLSSPVRLDIYRFVVREGVHGMVAGQIAAAVDLPPANVSFHLKAMTQAGLLDVAQEGRFQRYRATLGTMVDLLTYVTEECCAGHPEQCIEVRVRRRGGASRRVAPRQSATRA
jgi:ArsR family transcriptional regulator, arsenate/arsenite/antimonite-responsive transcriptional repressor